MTFCVTEWPMGNALRSVAFAAASIAAVLAQGPRQTGAITGHVVDATTGRPIAGATVRLNASQPGNRKLTPPRTTTSDSKGVFAFEDVEPADYHLTAENEDGVGRYGAKSRDSGAGRSVHVSDGGRGDSVTIPLWTLGTVEGRVTDERGVPLAGVSVQLESSEIPGAIWIKTGPGGHYRARHIRPGEYIAVVDNWLFNRPLEPDPPVPSLNGSGEFPPFLLDGDRRTVMYSALPVPANDEAGRRRLFVTSVYAKQRGGPAEPIHVTGADVHRGVDIIVGATIGVRVAGRLSTSVGPVKGGVINLRRVDLPEYPGTYGIKANARPDGTFAFVAVPPGHYALTAYKLVPPLTMEHLDEAGRPVTAMDDAFTSDNDDYFLQGTLDVGTADIPNLVLSIQPGTTVSGTLTLDDHFLDAAKPGCVYLLSLAKRLWDDAIVGCARPDGTFSLKARPGAYVITAGSKDWAYDGASIGGRYIADGPINVGSQPIRDVRVRLTSRSRRGITGTIMTSDGRVPDAARVIVFPQDRKWWPSRPGLDGMQIYPDRHKRTDLITDGRFEFVGLLPGEYFAAGVDDGEGLLAHPVLPLTTLNRLARIATRVTVWESGMTNVKLEMR
jgi:hypothetical protein